MKNPWIVIGVIVAVLIGGSVLYSNSVAESSNEGITFSPNIKGNPDATVTLTEYSDFQCPACASFQPVLEDLMNEFGDSLKIEFKHFPLSIHSQAESAARAAEAAGQQGKFFEYHDVLFANQSTWSNSPNPLLLFMQYAESLQLDVELFKRHYNASAIKDKVRQDLRSALEQKLTGTPTFFLNGERMNIESYEDFRSQIAIKLGITTDVSTDTASGTNTNTAQPIKFGI